MTDRMLVATRKGLLTLKRNGGWSVAATDFAGIPVTAALRDPRDGALYTVLKHLSPLAGRGRIANGSARSAAR